MDRMRVVLRLRSGQDLYVAFGEPPRDLIGAMVAALSMAVRKYGLDQTTSAIFEISPTAEMALLQQELEFRWGVRMNGKRTFYGTKLIPTSQPVFPDEIVCKDGHDILSATRDIVRGT